MNGEDIFEIPFRKAESGKQNRNEIKPTEYLIAGRGKATQ